jgi:hypothetical protein
MPARCKPSIIVCAHRLSAQVEDIRGGWCRAALRRTIKPLSCPSPDPPRLPSMVPGASLHSMWISEMQFCVCHARSRAGQQDAVLGLPYSTPTVLARLCNLVSQLPCRRGGYCPEQTQQCHMGGLLQCQRSGSARRSAEIEATVSRRRQRYCHWS